MTILWTNTQITTTTKKTQICHCQFPEILRLFSRPGRFLLCFSQHATFQQANNFGPSHFAGDQETSCPHALYGPNIFRHWKEECIFAMCTPHCYRLCMSVTVLFVSSLLCGFIPYPHVLLSDLLVLSQCKHIPTYLPTTPVQHLRQVSECILVNNGKF